jgi:hypothetical protein
MATVEADICNVALYRIGQKEMIASLDEASVQASACKVLYPNARDVVLASFLWAFAEKYATLALLVPTRTGWSYEYQLPSDCIAPRYISTGVRPGALTSTVDSICLPASAGAGQKIAFAIGASDDGTGRILLTDQAQAELVYTARITTVIAFPPLFIEALAYRLAADLALGLPVKPGVADQMERAFQMALARAGAAEFRGQQNDPQSDSEFITVRG